MLSAFTALMFSCTADDKTETPVDASENVILQGGGYDTLEFDVGVLIEWEPGTTELEKQSIRLQFDHLYTSLLICSSETEIWRNYCRSCQPFHDPEDGDNRIQSATRGYRVCPL